MISQDVFGWVILGVSVILPIAVGGVVIRVMAEGLRSFGGRKTASPGGGESTTSTIG